MAALTFSGGIHPYEGKELSKDKPMERIVPTGEMVYPLSQHIGAPATPIVTVGQRVLAGEKIAEANGFVSVPIYSSVSGTVTSLEKRLTVTGDLVDSIVIDNDGLFEEAPPMAVKPIADMTKEDIIALIREAGIVGMGGAGFPTHVKLSPKEPDKINYVIANCSECEPYLTSDYRRMVEDPDRLVAGLKIILLLFDHAKGILAVEDNKPDCIRKLKELVIDEPRITVKVLKTKYPQGSERQLIYATTKRAINSSMLPADAGCIVNNVDTICAVCTAVIEGKPLMHRIVTVTGDAVNDPKNFIVPIGTSYAGLIDAAGGLKVKPEKIVSGGPMMGFALYDINVPVTKTSSALLCMTKDEVARWKPSACIKCGKCLEVCPARLMPSKLADYAEHSAKEQFEKYYGMECVECGSCSYTCPAKRQLVQSIKYMRRTILADRRKNK
ncbi:MAG: electron transport complex subunit RsxC [Lachnospiraceae bacterium]|nr:electron transport complex subunit RsxC [Lachnospiraceae bacterium]MCR5268687.1 electron transport complex subunit RsxC [Lachnospiraceae bacterium]